jgi:hypothetical protein
MASKYAWLITKDYLAEESDDHTAEGVCGPRNASEDMLADLRAGKGRAFRMYDDDGILYVSGRIITLDEDDPTLSAYVFGPLDDYGVGWSRCGRDPVRDGWWQVGCDLA